MPPTFRGIGTAAEVASSRLTITFTHTAGDVLLVPFSIHDELTPPNSGTWNGSEAMSLVTYIGNAGTRGCGVYALAGATDGTHEAVIVHGTSETMAGVGVGYSVVDDGTPYDGAVRDAEAGGDQVLDVSVTSPAGDLAVVFACVADPSVTMSLTNGTEQGAADTGNFGFFVFDRAGQGGATQINGSFSANPFGFSTVGINLNAAAVPSSGAHYQQYYRGVIA